MGSDRQSLHGRPVEGQESIVWGYFASMSYCGARGLFCGVVAFRASGTDRAYNEDRFKGYMGHFFGYFAGPASGLSFCRAHNFRIIKVSSMTASIPLNSI